ncbi:MAG: hypothetical protein J0647_01520 [Campylobacteraceae bacterium]|nr:hypothetical protein [Campylobacteraceae bacterium]
MSFKTLLAGFIGGIFFTMVSIVIVAALFTPSQEQILAKNSKVAQIPKQDFNASRHIPLIVPEVQK